MNVLHRVLSKLFYALFKHRFDDFFCKVAHIAENYPVLLLYFLRGEVVVCSFRIPGTSVDAKNVRSKSFENYENNSTIL